MAPFGDGEEEGPADERGRIPPGSGGGQGEPVPPLHSAYSECIFSRTGRVGIYDRISPEHYFALAHSLCGRAARVLQMPKRSAARTSRSDRLKEEGRPTAGMRRWIAWNTAIPHCPRMSRCRWDDPHSSGPTSWRSHERPCSDDDSLRCTSTTIMKKDG